MKRYLASELALVRIVGDRVVITIEPPLSPGTQERACIWVVGQEWRSSRRNARAGVYPLSFCPF